MSAAIAAGADAFLNKPFSILNLQRQIVFARSKSEQRKLAAGRLPSPQIDPANVDLFEID